MIHPKFAEKIARMYVDVYRAKGFEASQQYLHRVCQGKGDLMKHLSPFILIEGRRK